MIALIRRLLALAVLFATPAHAAPNTWYVGADGWTVFNGSPGTGTCGPGGTNTGTCVWYVDPAGNDTSCAGQPLPVTQTPTLPCATPHRAMTQLRNGTPDWILMKKGATWVGIGLAGFNASGRSVQEPMLIASYGIGARPLFTTGGVDTPCYGTNANGAFGGQYVALTDIECYNDYQDPNAGTFAGVQAVGDATAGSAAITNMPSTVGIVTGMMAFGSGISGLQSVTAVTANSVTLSAPASFAFTQRPIQFNKRNTQGLISVTGITNFLIIENVKIRFGGVSIQAQTNANYELRMRRNVIIDGYGDVGRGGGGVFLGDQPLATAKILIEDNVVDSNGHNAAVWGAPATKFNHNFYLHDANPPIVFHGNITSNASATGGQIRNGGTVTDNLSLGNPVAFSGNPGIQFNATTYAGNVITEGSDNLMGQRLATADTPVGSAVISLDGILNGGSLSFQGLRVIDVTNPGAIVANAKTLGGTTITLTSNVSAGTRGDGVKAGDVLQILSLSGEGISVGMTGTFSPSPFNPANTGQFYPVGSTAFNFVSTPLPSWVVPGMNVAVVSHTLDFTGTQTTVLSVSADGTVMTTSAPSTATILGGEQNAFAFWTAGETARFPQNVFVANIFTNNLSLSPGWALALQDRTQAVVAMGNLYCGWGTPAVNISDIGVAGANQTAPNILNAASMTSCPNATIEAYDLSIGGPGTAAHFIAQARLQSHDTWDARYTAHAANTFIRNQFP